MIFNMEFKSNFGKMIAWTIVMVVLVGLLLLFYPFIMGPQMKQLFDTVVSQLPGSVRSILGFRQNMDYTNVGEYLALIYHYMAILFVIFAIQLGFSSLAKEQTMGNIQYIYSNPIHKSEIVTQKLAADVLIYILFLILLAIATFGIMFAIGIGMEQMMNIQDLILSIIKVFLALFGSGLVFMSIGFFFSSMSKSSLHSDALGVLFVLIVTIFIVVAKIAGGILASVAELTPTEAFHPFDFVTSNFNLMGLGINIILFILFMVLSFAIYSSKELKF